jgi:hypothetical protein
MKRIHLKAPLVRKIEKTGSMRRKNNSCQVLCSYSMLSFYSEFKAIISQPYLNLQNVAYKNIHA